MALTELVFMLRQYTLSFVSGRRSRLRPGGQSCGPLLSLHGGLSSSIRGRPPLGEVLRVYSEASLVNRVNPENTVL